MKRHTPGPIIELLDRHPSLFYGQQWYRGESFTRILPVNSIHTPPTGRMGIAKIPKAGIRLPCAVDLLNCYVQHPTDSAWDDFSWTADFDDHGQRIYVGGCANGHGMEIHRHLAITARWSIPVWD